MARKTCTIRYYRAVRAPTDRGTWPRDDDVRRVLAAATSTSLADPYLTYEGHSYIVERHAELPLHLAVSMVRRDNLPFLERGGQTSALPLPRGDNLAEPTHFVFLGSRIVAMVRGQTTPGHVTGAIVLSERGDLPLALAPILRPEVEALVQNSIEVAELDIRVAGSSFNRAAAEAGDPVEAVHRLTASFPGAMKAHVVLRATTGPERQRFRAWLLRQLREGTLGNGSGAEKARARVVDRSGERHWVDLVEDQIAHAATVTTTGLTRHLDPAEVYEAVLANFEEQRGVLSRAIEIGSE